MSKPKKRSYPSFFHIGIRPDVGRRLEAVKDRAGKKLLAGRRKSGCTLEGFSWTDFFELLLVELENGKGA